MDWSVLLPRRYLIARSDLNRPSHIGLSTFANLLMPSVSLWAVGHHGILRKPDPAVQYESAPFLGSLNLNERLDRSSPWFLFCPRGVSRDWEPISKVHKPIFTWVYASLVVGVVVVVVVVVAIVGVVFFFSLWFAVARKLRLIIADCASFKWLKWSEI